MRLNSRMESGGNKTGVGRWGGKRAGAGRKPAPTLRVSLKLPREVWAEIQVQADLEQAAPEALAARWLAERAGKSGPR